MFKKFLYLILKNNLIKMQIFFIIIFTLIFSLIAILTNSDKLLLTFFLGSFFSIFNSILFCNLINKFIKMCVLKSVSKKKYFWMWFLYFLIRMIFYFLAIIVASLFSNVFSSIILLLPFSFLSISIFLDAYKQNSFSLKKEEIDLNNFINNN